MKIVQMRLCQTKDRNSDVSESKSVIKINSDIEQTTFQSYLGLLISTTFFRSSTRAQLRS